MTAADARQETLAVAAQTGGETSSWRKWLAFGTGVAIEILDDALQVVVVRVRPNGPFQVERAEIRAFRERPAVEWSEEFRAAVSGHDQSGATVIVPRRDVIVRHVSLSGVARRDMEAAITLRLRGLHPFADDDVAWCWTPVQGGALVGLMRLAILAKYESLFAEAGISVASFSFSATVLHAALRTYGRPGTPVLGFTETSPGLIELYGESAGGAIFSGEFRGSVSRATSVAIAELRLPVETAATNLELVLPVSAAPDAPVPDRALVYAAATVNACPWLAKHANFLPPERRAGQSHLWLLPTLALSIILLVGVVAMLSFGKYREKRYIAALTEEIARVRPASEKATAIDARIEHARTQIQLLDDFKGASQSDFEILGELTRLIQPPAWTNLVEIYPDYVVVSGEAEQAAPLLGILDSSPLFRNSEFASSVVRSGKNEMFRIKTLRKVKK